MHPFRWNAFVIRMGFLGTWNYVELAGQDLVLPTLYVCKWWQGGFVMPAWFVWTGGDQGWIQAAFITPLPGHPHWPYGRAVSEQVLPLTGPP